MAPGEDTMVKKLGKYLEQLVSWDIACAPPVSCLLNALDISSRANQLRHTHTHTHTHTQSTQNTHALSNLMYSIAYRSTLWYLALDCLHSQCGVQTSTLPTLPSRSESTFDQSTGASHISTGRESVCVRVCVCEREYVCVCVCVCV